MICEYEYVKINKYIIINTKQNFGRYTRVKNLIDRIDRSTKVKPKGGN